MTGDGEAPDPPAPILRQVGRRHQPQPGPRGEAPPAGNRVGVVRRPEPLRLTGRPA
jgi:hypothetical protein